MAKEYAYKFYHSKAWKDCKRSFISERIAVDGGMCQECGKQLGYIRTYEAYGKITIFVSAILPVSSTYPRTPTLSMKTALLS